MKTDPWRQISAPAEARFAARRADAEHPYDFFWARDLDGHCLLVFEYPYSVENSDQRPALNGIRIFEPRVEGEPARLILELALGENRKKFHRLCADIIESTRECAEENSALATVLRRMWRWHGMSHSDEDERLGPEAQKDLISELRVLELALLPRFSANDALEFWCGAEGAPKDFSIGAVAIEAKASCSSAQPCVEITSGRELDTAGIARLFLAVTCVDEAAPNTQDALTLTDYVNRIREIAKDNDAGSPEHLDVRLLEAGYSSDDDYTEYNWVIENTRWFGVESGFPRLVDSELPNGVGNLRYSLDLTACAGWETDLRAVGGALAGGDE